jgi:hypothetical protein
MNSSIMGTIEFVSQCGIVVCSPCSRAHAAADWKFLT